MSVLIVLPGGSLDRAQQYAQTYGFSLADPTLLAQPGFHLCLDGQGLLLRSGAQAKADVRVDFSHGRAAHRRRFGGGQGQDIAKAIGVGKYKPSVIDATAGLGRDSFVLASLGCQVWAFERQASVAALLADGLARAQHDDDIADIIARIDLQYGASQQGLSDASAWPVKADVVYLDPMFEHDDKATALVKKDMQAFRHVVGQDDDAEQLLPLALAAARCRVVVKRARKAEPLAGQAPTYAIVGKANRFDVYVLAKVAPL
ncbi:MAG: class I SAM-dependent methyltransferase [Bacterioplanes sp.]|nr:class I SAM-dependent methyltransferase [Bacterioplanes sp.]